MCSQDKLNETSSSDHHCGSATSVLSDLHQQALLDLYPWKTYSTVWELLHEMTQSIWLLSFLGRKVSGCGAKHNSSLYSVVVKSATSSSTAEAEDVQVHSTNWGPFSRLVCLLCPWLSLISIRLRVTKCMFFWTLVKWYWELDEPVNTAPPHQCHLLTRSSPCWWWTSSHCSSEDSIWQP